MILDSDLLFEPPYMQRTIVKHLYCAECAKFYTYPRFNQSYATALHVYVCTPKYCLQIPPIFIWKIGNYQTETLDKHTKPKLRWFQTVGKRITDVYVKIFEVCCTRRVTMTTDNSKNGAIALSRMNFCGYLGYVKILSWMLATACCLVKWLCTRISTTFRCHCHSPCPTNMNSFSFVVFHRTEKKSDAGIPEATVALTIRILSVAWSRGLSTQTQSTYTPPFPVPVPVVTRDTSARINFRLSSWQVCSDDELPQSATRTHHHTLQHFGCRHLLSVTLHANKRYFYYFYYLR